MEFDQCQRCTHLIGYDRTVADVVCEAFPHGIPSEIWAGDFDHRNAHDGDNGMRFEAKEGGL